MLKPNNSNSLPVVAKFKASAKEAAISAVDTLVVVAAIATLALPRTTITTAAAEVACREVAVTPEISKTTPQTVPIVETTSRPSSARTSTMVLHLI